MKLLSFFLLASITFARAHSRPGSPIGRSCPTSGWKFPAGTGRHLGRSSTIRQKVRAAVFDDGKKRVAIVGLDALIIRRETAIAARKLVQQKTGLPPECVLLGASHSHTSGPVGMVLPGEFDHASPHVQELAYQKSSCADAKYLDRVVVAIADAIAAADASKTDALLSFGVGHEPTSRSTVASG